MPAPPAASAASATAVARAPPTSLLSLPAELLGAIASRLCIRDSMRLARTCRGLYAYRSEILRSCNPLLTNGTGYFKDRPVDLTEVDFQGKYYRSKPPLADAILVKKALEGQGVPKIQIFRWAVTTKHVELARSMVQQDGVTAADVRGMQHLPLRDAGDVYCLDMIRLLFDELGMTIADVRAIKNRPLKTACFLAKMDVVRYLVEEVGLTRDDLFLEDWGDNVFIKACWGGSVEVVRYLVEHYDLDARAIRRRCDCGNLVGRAARAGHEMVKYLMEELGIDGTEVYFSDDDIDSDDEDGGGGGGGGGGPEALGLFSLIIDSSLGALRYIFKKHGVTADDVRDYGDDVLTEVCFIGSLDRARFLIDEVGLTIEDVRSNNNAAFIAACQSWEAEEMVSYLIEKVGLTANDARAQDNAGFFAACKAGQVNTIKYLLQKVGVLDNLSKEKRKATLQKGLEQVKASSHHMGAGVRERIVAYFERMLRMLGPAPAPAAGGGGSGSENNLHDPDDDEEDEEEDVDDYDVIAIGRQRLLQLQLGLLGAESSSPAAAAATTTSVEQLQRQETRIDQTGSHAASASAQQAWGLPSTRMRVGGAESTPHNAAAAQQRESAAAAAAAAAVAAAAAMLPGIPTEGQSSGSLAEVNVPDPRTAHGASGAGIPVHAWPGYMPAPAYTYGGMPAPAYGSGHGQVPAPIANVDLGTIIWMQWMATIMPAMGWPHFGRF